MARARRAQWAAITTGLCGALLFVIVVDETDLSEEAEGLKSVDLRVAAWLSTHTPPLIFWIGTVAGAIGGGKVFVVLIAALSIASWTLRRRTQALVIAGGGLLLQAAIAAAKAHFERPRPVYGVENLVHDGFPSGHAALAAYVAVVLAWLALRHARPGRTRATLLGLAVAWMLVQSAGRMIIGVHYLTDVLAGVGLGLAVGGSALALAPIVEQWAGQRWDEKK